MWMLLPLYIDMTNWFSHIIVKLKAKREILWRPGKHQGTIVQPKLKFKK